MIRRFWNWLGSTPRRVIPLWVHVPWYVAALAIMIVRLIVNPAAEQWRVAAIWADGEDLTYRPALEALIIWVAASRWMRDPTLRWPRRSR